MHIRKTYFFYIFLSLLPLSGCEKYIEITPKGQLIPTTTEDFRMLLDQVQGMNFTGKLPDLASDDLTFSNFQFESFVEAFERNTYIWNKNIYLPEDQAYDWNHPYSRIYTANIILEGLPKTETGSPQLRRAIEGEALFHRGIAHFEIASLYAKSYNPATASNDLGIPLRIASDVFPISERPTLEDTYAQILDDLEKALALLPARSNPVTRASKVAVYALRARIHLDMGAYEDALSDALSALEIQPALIDYNTLNPNVSPVFTELNAETIFFSTVPFMGYSFVWSSAFPVSTALYELYSANDLRKSLFFSERMADDGTSFVNFNNTYGGTWNRFTGLATDELYLIVAETYARTGEYVEACNYLNSLLKTRYVTGTYVDFSSNDETEVLTHVLAERRKQLIGRNRRWFDLKRLRNDPRFAVALERNVLGTTYRLPPDDNRYIYPIPHSVINATGMEQNPR